MDMKKLFLKLLLAILPLAGPIPICIVLLHHASDSVCNEAIEAKVVALTKPAPDVIVGGDSRAEMQVDPRIFESECQLKAVNVAVSSGDLISLYHSLRKHGLLKAPITLIVSVSLFQINDGSTDPGYISSQQVAEMSFAESVHVFGPNLLGPQKMRLAAILGLVQRKLIAMKILREPRRSEVDNLGYVPSFAKLDPAKRFVTDPRTTAHLWYKNLSIHGVRWRIFRQALSGLAQSDCRIVIYQPPVSDQFRRNIENSPIERGELEFSSMLRDESARYPNVTFLDYFGQNPPTLSDSDYGDVQHLNAWGAPKFTELLIHDCIARGVLCAPAQ